MRFSALAVIALVFIAGCSAQSAPNGAKIEARNAWIRTPPPGAPTAAGYVTITNHQISSDRLNGASAPGVAAGVSLHEMEKAGGVMRMRPVEGGIPIGASETVSLAPNGRHLMLAGLKHPLKAGEHVRVVLRFERSGARPVDFVVRD